MGKLKFLAFFLLVVIFLSPQLLDVFAQSSNPTLNITKNATNAEPPFVPGQIIMSFKPGVTPEEIDDFYKDFYGDYHLVEKENLSIDDKDDGPEERLASTSLEVTRELIEIIKQDPRIEYAEFNYLLYMDVTPNDLQFDQLWGLHNVGQTGGTIDADIDAPEAWDTTTGSFSIIIGVIDTGINYNHVDLASNVWNNPGETGLDANGNDKRTNGIDDDGNGYIDDVHGINAITNSGDPIDDNSHGTHVSGTIGALGNNGIGVVGVNWDVSIASCKFLDSTGIGTTSNAIKCFKYFNSLKNVNGQNVVVTNNSWGGGGFSLGLKFAMAGSDQPGMSPILHVASAGNRNSDTDLGSHYPSSFDLDNIISVAATDHNDDYASFTNYGSISVDLAAPGVSILSTILGNSYGFKSGTSMAAPHVSGAAALIWSNFPASTYNEVKSRIMGGVDLLSDLTKNTQTDGRLNVLNSITMVNSPPIANDDSATTLEDTPITIDVLANDDDVDIVTDGDSISIKSVNNGATGTTSIVAGEIVYTPDSSMFGGDTDTFQYTIEDSNTATDTATVTITVNDKPSTPGKVTAGGGQLPQGLANFGFNIQSKDGSSFKGHLEYQDKNVDINLNSDSMTALAVEPSGTEATFKGTASVNKESGFVFKVVVEDNGEPGTADFFRIIIKDSSNTVIYESEGVLEKGNIQIHK